MGSSFTHHGPWDGHSRSNRALKFMERYCQNLDSFSSSSSSPPSTITTTTNSSSAAFYSPLAVFHDSKGDVYIGDVRVSERMRRLLAPFSGIHHEAVEMRVVQDGEGRDVVYGEFLAHFRLGAEEVGGGEAELVVPLFMVGTLGEGEDGERVAKGFVGERSATAGLQIQELKMFWDTGVIARFVAEKKQRSGLKIQYRQRTV